jgi:hypothetical protein
VANIRGEWNRVELPQGSLSTSLIRAVFNTQLNPRLSPAHNVQFDSVSRVLDWQSRFRWILKPGDDIYLVYGHDWIDSSNGLVTLNHSMTSKVIHAPLLTHRNKFKAIHHRKHATPLWLPA